MPRATPIGGCHRGARRARGTELRFLAPAFVGRNYLTVRVTAGPVLFTWHTTFAGRIDEVAQPAEPAAVAIESVVTCT